MLVRGALVVLCLLAFDGTFFAEAEPSWTSLRVTWGLNLFSSRNFAKIPRRESKARTEGWTKLPGECSGGKFLGHRYIKASDVSTIVMYDTNGFVAGIQHGIPKRDIENTKTKFPFATSPAYQLDVIHEDDVYFVTAYFVDPSIICHEGRSRDEYDEQGTGTGLYLQNGTNPIRDAVHVPLYEEGVNVTRWVKGGCFPSMGVHYWYDLHDNMDCDHFFPVTVIYNRGKVTSFAFASFGYYDFSERFEHPPESTLNRFLPSPVPQCIKDEYDRSGGFSSMHVFFSVRPWNILC